MAGASFTDYSDAFNKTTKHSTPIPSSALKGEETVQIRSAAQSSSVSAKNQHRNIGDIMQRTSGYRFVDCSCGLKIKIPPNFQANKVQCPRCGQVLAIS